MQESYHSNSGIKKLTKAEIKKMKENMQKVPLIQQKSEDYHRKEKEAAEKLLDRIETPSTKKKFIQEHTSTKSSLLKKIKNYLFGK